MLKKNVYLEQIPLIDPENAFCVDCHSADPQLTSINNAIFICWKCSIEHEKLGYNISYVRDINSKWDDYLFGFIRNGSNKQFLERLKEFNIDPNMSIAEKYKTRAVDHYRKALRARLFAQEAPNKPSLEDGVLPIEFATEDYIEFVDYKFVIVDKTSNPQGEKKNEKLLDKVMDTFSTMGASLLSFGKVCQNKVLKMQIQDKVQIGGEKAMESLKKAGTFVQEKTAPAMDYTKNQFTTLKDKVMKKKEPDDINVPLPEANDPALETTKNLPTTLDDSPAPETKP